MKTVLPSPQLARTGSLGPLSDEIILAVPGTFYVYQTLLTAEDPLYALLDCKANKRRPLAQITSLGREVHLHFEFDNSTRAQVTSIKGATKTGLITDAGVEFDDVYVAPAAVAIEDFYVLCAQRDSMKVRDLCEAACAGHETAIEATPGMIIAMMTSGGKYGLFLVKELSPTSASLEACHILF